MLVVDNCDHIASPGWGDHVGDMEKPHSTLGRSGAGGPNGPHRVNVRGAWGDDEGKGGADKERRRIGG